MSPPQKAIMWFRQDLRLHDNPALLKALEADLLFPIYIIDDENAGKWQIGSASKVWLHHALEDLNKHLKGQLSIFKGKADDIIASLVKEQGIDAVFWNRCYEPWRIKRDSELKTSLAKLANTEVKTYNASLLWEPWEIAKNDGTPYRVFTPFYKKGCLNAHPPRDPKPKPTIDSNKLLRFSDGYLLDDLSLLPKKPEWHKTIMTLDNWQMSEQGAHDRLDDFLENGLTNYRKGRDFPSMQSVSGLSPYLHFGQISPHTVWQRAAALKADNNRDHFLSELGWREFSYYLLYHFPSLPEENFQPKFNGFPWQDDEGWLLAWQKGETGVPMVDAGMRQLWQTGYMHNRVRMIVGSYLIKNLLIDWRHGQDWFWDCLFDADLASNAASWQWVAGSGADAAPYFRIFNPVTQGQKFDPDGDYVRQYVPELKDLPNKYIHCPWEADFSTLRQANVILGKTYPQPLVDLKESRQKALTAYDVVKSASAS